MTRPKRPAHARAPTRAPAAHQGEAPQAAARVLELKAEIQEAEEATLQALGPPGREAWYPAERGRCEAALEVAQLVEGLCAARLAASLPAASASAAELVAGGYGDVEDPLTLAAAARLLEPRAGLRPVPTAEDWQLARAQPLLNERLIVSNRSAGCAHLPV